MLSFHYKVMQVSYNNWSMRFICSVSSGCSHAGRKYLIGLVKSLRHHNETARFVLIKPIPEDVNVTETTLIKAEYHREKYLLLYGESEEPTNKHLGIAQKLTVLSFHFKFFRCIRPTSV